MNQEAIHHYKQAIQLNKDYTNAYLMLGNVYADLGELKKAYENYKEAQRVQPDLPETMKSLSVISLWVQMSMKQKSTVPFTWRLASVVLLQICQLLSHDN